MAWTKKGQVSGDKRQGQEGGGRREGAPQCPSPLWACVSVLVRTGLSAGDLDRRPDRGDWSPDQKLRDGGSGGSRKGYKSPGY